MPQNVLRRANVRLLPGDEKTAERMPQVVESEPLSRLEVHPCLSAAGRGNFVHTLRRLHL